SSPVPGGSQDLRPRPLAITPTPAVPLSMNRLRQRRTVSESTALRRAISSLATPSPAHNNARAWTTCRCGNTDEAAIRDNSARCSSDTTNGAAVMTGITQPTATSHRQTTTRPANPVRVDNPVPRPADHGWAGGAEVDHPILVGVSRPLCVLLPEIGVVSETFIRWDVHKLLPGW